MLTYMVSALFLGVYFAMSSGTLDSMVYDTVLEEAGNSELFEHVIGRIRLASSFALVLGALAGAAIAEAAPLRVTFFLTVPLVAAGGLMLLVYREPSLHKAGDAQPLRRQIAATYRTLLERDRLRLVVALTVLTSLLLQAMLEFGPLWLVALSVPAILYGPHWAGLTAGLGLGGLLGSVSLFTRAWALWTVSAAMIACCVVLTVSHAVAAVVAAQVILTLLVVAVGVPLLRVLHDAVPSTLRAGVASGVSTLSWLIFLPFALVFGIIADRAGVYAGGWTLIAFAAGTAVLTMLVIGGIAVGPARKTAPELERAVQAAAAVPVPAGAARATFAPGSFLPEDHAEWPGHWADPPRDWEERVGVCVEGQDTRSELRAAIAALPPQLRRVMVLRDVQDRTPAQVIAALGLNPEQERALLNQARAQVRERLERYFEARTDERHPAP